MCDANRPAKIEDKLVATKFHNSITRGFAAVGQPNVAVCLLPGTEIAFDESVECEPSFGIGILPNKKIGQRLARFRQVNMDNPVAHHDALEFPDGQVVLVTRLCDGQWQPRASRTCHEGCDRRLKWYPERLSQPRGPRGPRQGLLPEAAAFDTTDV